MSEFFNTLKPSPTLGEHLRVGKRRVSRHAHEPFRALTIARRPSLWGPANAIGQKVVPAYQGRLLRAAALEASLRAMIAPVRPTMKARYALAPMEDYVGWRNAGEKLSILG